MKRWWCCVVPGPWSWWSSQVQFLSLWWYLVIFWLFLWYIRYGCWSSTAHQESSPVFWGFCCILAYGFLVLDWWLLSFLSLEKMQYSVFSLLSFILHWLLHVFIWFRSSCSLDSINFLFSSVCQIVASSANLQWSAVMLLNISLMKMLKRMGEITDPCGRPILVWNHTGSRSNRPQTKSAPSQIGPKSKLLKN